MPDLFDRADEVHVSVTFTYDLPRAEELADQWKHVAPVTIGGRKAQFRMGALGEAMGSPGNHLCEQGGRMKLRPYQVQAHDAVFKEWKERRSTLLEMATGTGKTIVFSGILKTLADQGRRGLVLAHRDELIRQAANKLKAATGIDCAVEKADERGDNSMFPVVVASVQTLMRQKRLERFGRDEFAAVIIDEAHHALSDSYRRILDWFGPAKVLGVTATPDRGDKRNLGAVFESIAFSYGLRSAVADGNLSRITAQTLPLKIDMTGVGMRGGDYDEAQAGDALAPYLPRIAAEIKARAGGRKTLAFLPLRATSRMLTEHLLAVGLDARHVDGESADRADVLAWLATPGPKVCCNAMLLTEGFDEPSVDCIVPLRPTKSRALYTQIVGRGTRLSGGKADMLLLDFLWLTAAHDLCRPAHLVAGSAEVAEKAIEMAEAAAAPGAAPEQMDLLDMVELAREETVRQRHEALARQLKAAERRKGRLVDPVMLGVIIGDADIEGYEPTMQWEERPPSDAQLKALERFGVDPGKVTCKGQASLIMGKMIERSRLKLASMGKVGLLQKHGYDAGAMSSKDADALINGIKANNWRVEVSFE